MFGRLSRNELGRGLLALEGKPYRAVLNACRSAGVRAKREHLGARDLPEQQPTLNPNQGLENLCPVCFGNGIQRVALACFKGTARATQKSLNQAMIFIRQGGAGCHRRQKGPRLKRWQGGLKHHAHALTRTHGLDHVVQAFGIRLGGCQRNLVDPISNAVVDDDEKMNTGWID